MSSIGTPGFGRKGLARLAARCAHQFSRRSIERAHTYVETHQVELRELDERSGAPRVFAAVRGSRPRPYVVGIDLTLLDVDATVACGCTCPFASEGNLCKHVFAVLLAIDAATGDADLRGAAGGAPLRPGDSVPRAASVPGLSLTIDPLGITRFDPRVLAEREEAWFGPPKDAEPATADWTRDDDDEIARSKNGLRSPKPRGSSIRANPTRRDIEEWQVKLFAVERAALGRPLTRSSPFTRAERDRSSPIYYVVDVDLSLERGGLVVGIFDRQDTKGGGSRLRPLSIATNELDDLPDPQDRNLLRMLTATPVDAFGPARPGRPERRRPAHESLIPPSLYELIVPALAATGRFECQAQPISFDDGPPWRFALVLRREVELGEHALAIAGRLVRPRRGRHSSTNEASAIGANEARDLEEPLLILANGLVLYPGRIARLDAKDDFHWILLLRSTSRIHFQERALPDVLAELARMRDLPPVYLDPAHAESIDCKILQVPPRPKLSFDRPEDPRSRYLTASLSFEYAGRHSFGFGDPGSGQVEPESKTLVLRERQAEADAAKKLAELGATRRGTGGPDDVDVRPRDFAKLVRELAAEGWFVEASGARIRAARISKVVVASGVDWFDLRAFADFDGLKVALPALLAAVKKSDRIRLDDGSQGILPEDWLKRFGAIAELGEAHGDAIRFARNQAAIVDLVIEGVDRAEVDPPFLRAREQLASFTALAPRDAPASFRGKLRDYQREGLGWLAFLEELGLGGCLADDMGLGKTVQVLAHLASKEHRRPALVVAPRSLVHHWIAEAERFTPELSALDYTGPARLERSIAEYDLIVTTYGTVRRDIASLKDFRFDTVIFDEAQALKNPLSLTAKACRALAADHRLALSGTPVENHLFELWSIFEILNPGMLGSRAEFSATFAPGDPGDSLKLLARALRPLILRRTKAQVLKELPEKTELTLWCQLDEREREHYSALRDHYRVSLAEEIRRTGIERAQLQVLEALLRLRQAACHPALIDPRRAEEDSTKLEVLLAHLEEVVDEGHKVLVFSQFVKLLELVRARLDKKGTKYEYLDGATKDRASRVARFQRDEKIKIFLISLKAGGLGLNLTAADYVFILDPWWNPAVEAQAIDRAHRLGQTRAVFAYRLIAAGTVEEKILELQAKKRKLADAILSEDNAEIGRITAEDLALLLG